MCVYICSIYICRERENYHIIYYILLYYIIVLIKKYIYIYIYIYIYTPRVQSARILEDPP